MKQYLSIGCREVLRIYSYMVRYKREKLVSITKCIVQKCYTLFISLFLKIKKVLFVIASPKGRLCHGYRSMRRIIKIKNELINVIINFCNTSMIHIAKYITIIKIIHITVEKIRIYEKSYILILYLLIYFFYFFGYYYYYYSI